MWGEQNPQHGEGKEGHDAEKGQAEALKNNHNNSINSINTKPKPEAEAERQHKRGAMQLWRQDRVRAWYLSRPVQIGVAVVIFVNFAFEAVRAQLKPANGTVLNDAFDVVELFFTAVFTVELLFNMYGHFLREFWLGSNRAWNLFDTLVVAVSLVAALFEGLPAVTILRVFRAFRVFRLFKRVESLRIIIEGVFASLPGVTNAFIVLAIVMGIWSIMGVEFFRASQPQEFGNFARAMFSMWQIMTMDSWAASIARPAIYDHNMPLASLFFISYIFVAGIVLANVVVAVLLEKFLTTTKQNEMRKLDEAKKQQEERYNELEENERRQLDSRTQLINLVQDVITEQNLENLNDDELATLLSVLWKHPVSNKILSELVNGPASKDRSATNSVLLDILFGNQGDNGDA